MKWAGLMLWLLMSPFLMWAETTVEVGSDEVVVVVFDASVTQQEVVDFRFKVSAFGRIDRVSLNGVPLVQPQLSSDEVDYTVRLKLEPGENEFVIEAWSESGFYQKTWTIFRETEEVRYIRGPRSHWNWITLLERSWDTNVSKAPESGEVRNGAQWRLTLVPRWSYRLTYWTEVVVQGVLTQNEFDDASLNPYESQVLQLSAEAKQGLPEEGQWLTKLGRQEVAVNGAKSTLRNQLSLGWNWDLPRWGLKTEGGWSGAEATALSPSGTELSWLGEVRWKPKGTEVTGRVSLNRGVFDDPAQDFSEAIYAFQGQWTLSRRLQTTGKVALQTREQPFAPDGNTQAQTLENAWSWKASADWSWRAGLTRIAEAVQTVPTPEESVRYRTSVEANGSISKALKVKFQLASEVNRSNLENAVYEQWTWGGTLIWIL